MVITKAWQLGSFDKERTSEFVGEIQTMIDNYPSKLIRPITKRIGVSEFLIRQVVHDDDIFDTR